MLCVRPNRASGLVGTQLLLLNFGLSGGNDVVDVGGHKGFDLHVLLLLQQLLQHVHVAVLGVLHQHQVSCQAFLHDPFGVQADPLEVGANLRKETSRCCVCSLKT